MINCVVNIMSCKSWTKRELNILKNSCDKSISDIQKLLPDRSRGSIITKRNKTGFHNGRGDWAKKEIDILKNNQEKSAKEIQKLIPHRSVIGIKHKRQKLGLSKGHQYLVDIDYFKKWSKNMAYILGMLAADGCLWRGTSNRTYLISLFLKEDDVELIKKIVDCLGKTKIKSRGGDSKGFAFGCKEMFNDLVNLGVTPKKSLTLEFPKVSKKYLRHFIRGYFDGDGCVSLSITKGREYVSIAIDSGSEKFLKSLKKIIKSLFPHLYINIVKDKRSGTHRLRMYGCNALKFLNWIYKNSRIKLERKYQKYKETNEIYIKRGKLNYGSSEVQKV